ncbi:hypothetical protein GEV33_010366 [Tenebrio molitor]|uniref:Uncharacterized protein n=1 Tax=Tenebrio molitor TaxID=7067 RepID=A0A8J6H5U2_TENMO|nr:hypothetical protein GEV33_010366 [Tenebrio molitor]
MESLLICYMRTGAVMLRHNHHGDGVRWAVRRHMLPAPRRRRPTDLSRREDKLAQFFGDATCLSALKVATTSPKDFFRTVGDVVVTEKAKQRTKDYDVDENQVSSNFTNFEHAPGSRAEIKIVIAKAEFSMVLLHTLIQHSRVLKWKSFHRPQNSPIRRKRDPFLENSINFRRRCNDYNNNVQRL